MKISFTAKNFLMVNGIFFILIGWFYGYGARTFTFWASFGMYLGAGIFILCGALIERYRSAALLLNTLCMGGVVIGHLFGFVTDNAFGFATDGALFVFVILLFIVELILLSVSLWFLLKKNYFTTE